MQHEKPKSELLTTTPQIAILLSEPKTSIAVQEGTTNMSQTATVRTPPAINIGPDLRLAIDSLGPRVVDLVKSRPIKAEVETIEYLTRQLGALGRMAVSRQGDEFDFPLQAAGYSEQGLMFYVLPLFVVTSGPSLFKGLNNRVPRIICTRNLDGQFVARRIDY